MQHHERDHSARKISPHCLQDFVKRTEAFGLLRGLFRRRNPQEPAAPSTAKIPRIAVVTLQGLAMDSRRREQSIFCCSAIPPGQSLQWHLVLPGQPGDPVRLCKGLLTNERPVRPIENSPEVEYFCCSVPEPRRRWTRCEPNPPFGAGNAGARRNEGARTFT